MQLLEGQKQLGSTMWCNSGASPVRVVHVEVPKQDMVGRGIGNSSRNKVKNLMSAKWKGLIRVLVFRGGWGEISRSVLTLDHDILDAFNRALEA